VLPLLHLVGVLLLPPPFLVLVLMQVLVLLLMPLVLVHLPLLLFLLSHATVFFVSASTTGAR
jgi:hypothetical protein